MAVDKHYQFKGIGGYPRGRQTLLSQKISKTVVYKMNKKRQHRTHNTSLKTKAGIT